MGEDVVSGKEVECRQSSRGSWVRLEVRHASPFMDF